MLGRVLRRRRRRGSGRVSVAVLGRARRVQRGDHVEAWLAGACRVWIRHGCRGGRLGDLTLRDRAQTRTAASVQWGRGGYVE